MMKKLFSALLCMVLLLGVPGAFAGSVSDEPALPWWCMLEWDDTVLTLTLPMEDALECAWHISVSDESMIELITCEVLGDEPDESDEPLWIGSFASFARREGGAVLQLTQIYGEVPLRTYLLNLYIMPDGAIRVLQAIESEFPYAQDLYYLQVGAYALPENAENQLLMLTQMGFDGLIKYSDGLYKVQAGAFALRENAQNQLHDLRMAGFEDAFITTGLTGEIVAGADALRPPFFAYRVEQGDTLWGLARRFLGGGAQWEQIALINGTGMEIYAGQILLIPH